MIRIGQWLRAGIVAVLMVGASTAGMPAGAASAESGAGAALTVQQILDRHATARGGLAAWRKIQTMAWTGRIESGPGGTSKHPFLMLFRRPNATRFEVFAAGQRSVRIFDGTKGWKLRPTAEGVPDLQDYTAEEITFAGDAGGLDGPLVDSKTKAIGVTLQGMDLVEGHRAYHLRVTLPSGQVRNDWIDAQSFLELRYDRAMHGANGRSGVVSVYLRNYQSFNGLQIPLLVETGEPAAGDTDKMIIEKIALDPAFDATQFARPDVPLKRQHGALVNTEPYPGAAPPGQ
jgi:hypothetical protein